jgi:DNA-binding CsgD family transcriptional regulator
MTDPIIEGFSAGKGADFVEPYSEYYVDVDPFAEVMSQFDPGRYIGRGSTVVPREELVRSEYYNDLCLPLGLDDSMCAAEISERHGVSSLAAWSDRGLRLSTDQVELLELLAPHLFQAITLSRAFDVLRFERQMVRQALSRADFGCVFVDHTARVQWMNRRAEDIMATRTALKLDGGRLEALDEASDGRLQAALRDALQLSTGEFHAPRAMFKLQRTDGEPAIECLASPLKPMAVSAPTAGLQAGVFEGAMVILCDPTFVDEGLSARLENLYELTPTEAEVAQWLLSGSSVQEIADIFGNSVNTIRTHLKGIFTKTGTTSQAEVVGLLQRSLARIL